MTINNLRKSWAWYFISVRKAFWCELLEKHQIWNY